MPMTKVVMMNMLCVSDVVAYSWRAFDADVEQVALAVVAVAAMGVVVMGLFQVASCSSRSDSEEDLMWADGLSGLTDVMYLYHERELWVLCRSAVCDGWGPHQVSNCAVHVWSMGMVVGYVACWMSMMKVLTMILLCVLDVGVCLWCALIVPSRMLCPIQRDNLLHSQRRSLDMSRKSFPLVMIWKMLRPSIRILFFTLPIWLSVIR